MMKNKMRVTIKRKKWKLIVSKITYINSKPNKCTELTVNKKARNRENNTKLVKKFLNNDKNPLIYAISNLYYWNNGFYLQQQKMKALIMIYE